MRSLLAAVRRPDIGRFYEFETEMMALASPRQLERMAARFKASPELAPAFAERYLPRTRTVEEAERCAPGSLGAEYAAFMKRHGLSADYLPPRELAGDLTWFRARQVQAHDFWHAALGIGADLPGEVEIVAVLFAQFRRALPRELLAPAFSFLLVFIYLAHVSFTAPRTLAECVRRFRAGYRRGWSTAPLWAVRFEALLDRPLAEVQAQLTARSTGAS
jgi:ubiquinone biosynthesis protein Coq4